MHICFKIIKFLLHSTLLYVFRTPLCPSSGAFHHFTCSLWLPCGVVLVAFSSPVLLLLPLAVTTGQMHICFKILKFLLHSTLLYMFRTLLCPSSGAFHRCTCSLWLRCGVVLDAYSSPALLLLPLAVTTEQGLEDATNTTPHRNQRLHVQWWKAPDDGHNSVRNM
jgi:hypothetical protein